MPDSLKPAASIPGMHSRYSEFAKSQHQAIQYGLDRAIRDLILPAASKFENDQVVQLVDLGAADGANSFPVVDRFIRSIQSSAARASYLVSHVDLPSANLNELSANLFDLENTYRKTLADTEYQIQSSLVPGSFYDEFMLPESADIIFSTTSLHYASRVACGLTDHISPLSANPAESASWKQQSIADLDLALSRIHRVLKPGGCLWVVVPAQCLDETQTANYWYREILDIMSAQLKTLVDQGAISSDQWTRFVIPAHQRDKHLWQDWFDKNTSMFELKFLYTNQQPNPYLHRYKTEHRNPQRFVDEYLASIRAWSEQIISNLIPDEEMREGFFASLRSEIAASPERFENDTVSLYAGAVRL